MPLVIPFGSINLLINICKDLKDIIVSLRAYILPFMIFDQSVRSTKMEVHGVGQVCELEFKARILTFVFFDLVFLCTKPSTAVRRSGRAHNQYARVFDVNFACLLFRRTALGWGLSNKAQFRMN
jgi:hypothetical protein